MRTSGAASLRWLAVVADVAHRRGRCCHFGTCRTQKEVLRKRDAFRKLANERTRLRGLEKSGLSATDKDALLGSNSARAPTAYSNAPQANPEQLMQRTQQEIKNQDELLGAMSKGLDSLKTMGLAIRDETDLHMRLIDDLEDGVDNAHAGLKRETARAEHVTKDAKTCWLYAAICILLAVLIALVVARWH